MAALTSFRETKSVTLGPSTLKLDTGVTLYAGGLVCTDTATGYAVAGQVKTGLVARGVSRQTVDNSAGQAGDKSAAVEEGRFWLDIYSGDAVTQAHVDQPVFIYDDHTIARTDGSAARSVAGVLRAVDSARGALVEVSCANSTAIAAEIAAREALATDLASATGTTLAGVLGVKQAATVADSTVGLPVIMTVAVADGATGNVDVTMPAYKIEVISATFNKNASAGGASDTIQLANGATTNYITNAMDINVAANTVVRSTTLLSANATLAASATLRIIRTKASAANVGGTVVITGVRRA